MMEQKVYRFKTQPYKHQLKCFELNKDKRCYAYLMEMGTGKSKVLIDTTAFLYDTGKINAAFIVANKGSYTNWITTEIPTHMPDHINYEAFIWKATMGKKETEDLNRFVNFSNNNLKIFIMNVEALPFKRSFEMASTFVKKYETLMAVDESTTIKNPNAQRTKAAWKLGDVCKARRIMTGSLVDNNPLDAYAQFRFLGEGLLGHTSYYSFRARYAILQDMTNRTLGKTFKVVVGTKNLDELKAKINQLSFIIKKEECLDLPPKVYSTYNVELTDEQKRIYNSMKSIAVAQLDNEGSVVSAKTVLVRLLRLHQVVCGHTKDDDGTEHDIENNRIEALKTLLEESNGQVIIWANYRRDIAKITEAIGAEYGAGSVLTYFGDSSEEEKKKAKEVFRRGNDTKGVRFLVSNQVCGGYGNTFTGANLVIYYSNNYDAEKRNQSEDRAHRIGQTEKVTYIDLVSPGTVDEKILKALKKKKSISEMITQSNWREFF